MHSTNHEFPSLPECKGSYSVIFIEPIMLSGERIAMAVAAVTEDGETKILDVVGNNTWKYIYKNKCKDIQDQVQWVIESLDKHLNKHYSMDGWEPPLSGIFASKVRKTSSGDIDGIIRQAIMLHCSLFSNPEFSLEPNTA